MADDCLVETGSAATSPADTLLRFERVFAGVKSRFDAGPRVCEGLVCKQGSYMGSVVLKLQKAAWTNDRMDQVRNESGIFFSIWVNGKAVGKVRVLYNIHALKLRYLKGYSITSRDFAKDFRRRFAPLGGGWPNVSVEYGPLTLMEGWIEVGADSAGDDVLGLMQRFEGVSPLIDRMLEVRRR